MDMKIHSDLLLSLLLLPLLYVSPCNSSGSDTISAGNALSGYQTITSSSGNFVLGFFDTGGASNFYIGTWYNKLSIQTIVWVANRDRPISDRSSAELRIENGNLELVSGSGSKVWSTNLKITASSSESPELEAVLLDSGNLVLRHKSNTSGAAPIWESFDHPTHTWLPGSKIGLNKRTGTTQRLTSWRNSEDPAPGLFSLQLDPNESSQLSIFWNRSRQYWTSGHWNGSIFSLVPEMSHNSIYNFFSYVNNENESYFVYSVTNKSIVSWFVMDISGQLKQQSWLESRKQWALFWAQPRQQCEVYNLCGAYGICQNDLPFCQCLVGFEPRGKSDWSLGDYSSGCVRKAPLNCGSNGNSGANGEKYWFLKNSTMKLPENAGSVTVGSVTECGLACLNNCSCTAYAYESGGCSIWTGNLMNVQQLSQGDSEGKTLYVRLVVSEIAHKSDKGTVLGIALGSTAGVLALLGLILVFFVKRRRKLAMPLPLSNFKNDPKDFIGSGDFKNEDKEGVDVPFFDFESMLAATDYFSDANKLGQGGFGPVYKGRLNGQNIAVKRLSSGSGQGLKEFRNEIVLIAKLQHRNLVRLLGYCIQGDEQILLYEYMPNKSLDAFIFDQSLCLTLNWEKRFDIILGIARGLLYLHQDSRLRIIHRDLKTSNILLDEEMVPKISDFGLARIVGGKQTEANTNKVVGTYGYMAPEYALDGFFSVKSDVFSFGVVLLEIISGKRNTGFYQSEQGSSLLGYAWRLWREENAVNLMDASLSEDCNREEVLKCINIGLLCVQENPNDRPTMSNVGVMLVSEAISLPIPKPPAFTVQRGLRSSSSSSSQPKPCSNLELTVTGQKEGR